MKCWKCGKELSDGAAVCISCGISTVRKNPVTPAGKAMRQIYDHFGFQMVFDKKTVLPAALGDLLEDSKKLRTQLDMVISSGIGSIYANQLHTIGKPDAEFYAKVKSKITADAGLSDAVASELIGYFDEMIGWSNASQTNTQSTAQNNSGTPPTPRPAPTKEVPRPTPNKEIPRPTPNKEIPRPAPNKEIPRPAPTKEIPRPTPTKEVPRPAPNNGIPLPTAPVPKHVVGCGGVISQILLLGLVGGLISGGISTITSGMWPVSILCFLLAIFFYSRITAKEHYPGERKLQFARTDSAVKLSWQGSIDKFAVAIDDKWVLTGSGSSVMLPGNLFSQYKPGQKMSLVLAEITGTGVALRGQLDLEIPKQK